MSTNCNFLHIRSLLNGIVDTLLCKGYALAHGYNVYDRWTFVKDGREVALSLDFFSEDVNELDYPAQCVCITFTDACGLKECLHKFYRIGSDFFTSDIYTLISSRKKQLNRFLVNSSHNALCQYIDHNKISQRVKDYVTIKINKHMDLSGRSHDFCLRDLYFSYGLFSGRQLIAVIKHEQCNHTEAIYIF
jgi:hypothetical protein